MAVRQGQDHLALVVEEETQDDGDEQALQPEQPPTQDDSLESTELERIRKNYSRVSASRRSGHGSTVTARKPTTLVERFTYNVKKFWRYQVSVSVAHETSRDHLGMYPRIFFLSSCPSDTFTIT
jgi:hypothetical protein